MIKRNASAVWTGGLKNGRGTLSTASGSLKDQPYSFAMRFENAPGTNPEELIGAAHAGCYSMALSGVLEQAGLKPERLETHATVSMEKTEVGFTVTAVHLELSAEIPGADPRKFEDAANAALKGCPISRLLNAQITLDARLNAGTRA